MNLGNSGNDAPALLVGVIGAVAVFLLILIYVNGSLRRFRSISAAQAIQFGAQADPVRSFRTAKLSGNQWFSSNFILGLKDVLPGKRLYAIMLTVIILAGFITIVPQKLYHTICGDKFVT